MRFKLLFEEIETIEIDSIELKQSSYNENLKHINFTYKLTDIYGYTHKVEGSFNFNIANNDYNEHLYSRNFPGVPLTKELYDQAFELIKTDKDRLKFITSGVLTAFDQKREEAH